MDRPGPPTDAATAAPAYPRRPRWVVIGLAIAAALVIGVVILLVSGGHGPQRHSGGGSSPSHSEPSHANP
jgi:hypothetical protein